MTTNKNSIAIRAGMIGEIEIAHLNGYMCATNKETRAQFERERVNDIPFKVGHICLDLYDGYDLIDTLTITRERYASLIGAA